MDNNNVENNVVQNTSNNTLVNEQNVVVNNSENKNNKKKNSLKKIAIILLSVSVILIILGVVSSFGVTAFKENKKQKNKELAQRIFEETGMDEYLKEIFIPGVQLDTDLLDSNVKFMTDIYNNDSVPKYLFLYNVEDDASWIYIKYEDYANEYKKVYNKDLTFSMLDSEMAFDNLVHIDDNRYLFNVVDAFPCTSSNVDKCYVNITKQIVYEREVEFSSFDLKDDNVVVFDASVTYNNNNTKSVLDGKFELKFKEEKNEYIVESIKLISTEERVLTRLDS